MAPNKKSLSLLVQSLSNHDLTGLIKSEYLPLTHAKTAIAPVERQAVIRNTELSQDYWSWSVDEGESQEVTSCECIEAQLLEDAVCLTAAEKDAYWDEPSYNAGVTSAEQESYWNWSSNANDHLFTAKHIEANLTSFVAPDVVRTVHAADTDKYWEVVSVKDKEAQTVHSGIDSSDYWNTPNTADDIKAALIHLIVKEDTIRQMLSAEHVESQLTKNASDSYWQWQESCNEDNNNYWIWKAESRPISMGPENYWDM